jgi:endoglucanase
MKIPVQLLTGKEAMIPGSPKQSLSMSRIIFLISLTALVACQEKTTHYAYDPTGALIRGDSTQAKLSLVFTGDQFADGGETILQTLARHEIKGAFFLTGNFYRNARFTQLIDQLKAAGHYLGAHSDRHLLYCAWDEERTRLVSQDSFARDLRDNYEAMSQFGIARSAAPWYLPPYEWNDATITDWTEELGFQLINYTPGTLSHADYTTPDLDHYRSSETIYQSILDYEEQKGLNGFILLAHIGTAPERTDKFYHRLDPLISELKSRGYRFVSLEELLN